MKATAVLVRRNGGMGLAALGGLACVAAAVVISTVSPLTAPGLVVPIFTLGTPLSIAVAVAWFAYAEAWRHAVEVEVLDGALRIDGKQRRTARQLTGGEALPVSEGCVRVDLRARHLPRVRLELSTIAAARELLAALGLDRRAGTSKFRVRRLRPHAALVMLGVFFLVPMAFLLCTVNAVLGFTALALVILTPIASRLLANVELTIGADGIDLRSPRSQRFLPHARIRKIEKVWPERHDVHSTVEGQVVSWGFEITLDDETVCGFDTRPERSAAGVWSTDPVFDAALAAWSAFKDAGPNAPAIASASASLARGARSTPEWIAELRGLGLEGARGYRVAAVDEQALFSVLVDAGAPRELRAAAAVVLGAKEEHALRLRVVADDVADPVVRRVAVASATSAPLEAELDEASPTGERQGRASTRGPS